MKNYGRLSEGLHRYRDTMRGFVARRLRQAFPQGDWFQERVVAVVPPAHQANLERDLAQLRTQAEGKKVRPEAVLDIQHFFHVISKNWREAFASSFKENRKVLNWIREVGDERNDWAHPPLGDLEASDVTRTLDTAYRVLEYVDRDAAKHLAALRDQQEEPESAQPPAEPPPAVSDAPAATAAPPPKGPVGGLTPWRDVITPHPDVQQGRYVKAEFAADLQQVVSGKATAEYGDAGEFFRRTYMTGDMHRLLVSVVRHLRGEGRDPVIDLKTAFGGGKTHTLLAVYHLVTSPKTVAANEDVQTVYAEAGGPPPAAKVAVLVGTHLDPLTPTPHPDTGLETLTLWGEMAHQLAGKEGYALVAEHDTKGVAPGRDVLGRLFALAGPSVVLIDELVAYLRNVPSDGRPGDAVGTYGAYMTFCQNLTEAAKEASDAIVLASIPESNIEFGDARGAAIASQISNVFQRVGAPWQPVGGREAFEVVRRRLFGEIRHAAERDRTCEAYWKMYRDGTDFPTECREPSYLERMKASYPIHPEIFERLYVDWSGNIDRFQRTRGVLRLMADAIYRLWERGDQEPLITPGSLPLYDSNVRQQLVGYLGDQWNGPFDADVDGEQSAAASLERENQRFGKPQAGRRLTRTIFLGSVPGKSNTGLEVARILLGAVQPGEGVSLYGDALRALSAKLSYLHGTQDRYWFGVNPNLNSVAADRIARITNDEALEEIRRRLRQNPTFREKGEFGRLHAAPQGPGDVGDDMTAGLVILDPRDTHVRNGKDTPALKQAAAILDSRGTTPRSYRNMLVFLAADSETLASATEDARRYLGWKSIADDGTRNLLQLDQGQQAQAQSARDDADRNVDTRMSEAYRWLVVPTQHGTEPMEWAVFSVGGTGGLNSNGKPAERASLKLVTDGLLITEWSALLLKRELDQWVWNDGKPHVGLKQVWSYLCTYPYFSRLRDESVLREAVKAGVRSRDYFGYADGIEGDRYLGLVFGEAAPRIIIDDSSVLVRPEIAAERVAPREPAEPLPPAGGAPGSGTGSTGTAPAHAEPAAPAAPTRFFGTTTLNPARLSSTAGQIGEEVVQHLNSLMGAEIEVRIEIHAKVPGGIPDQVIRTVTENARTLKFDQFGFEDE